MNDKNVVVIVQCRLSSTRLPQKALLPLGDKCVLQWTLDAMKKVYADRYFLAVDEESKSELEPVAAKCGWEFFAGSQKDVLDRFCKVIELSNADVVVRGTADNPFLFYEAANEMVEEYFSRTKEEKIDYLTLTGLPHGSGVEMFDAHSLLEAREMTSDPYDHEHVGPALYNHKDKFNSVFVKASDRFYHPELRTTIDTPFDYKRAMSIVDHVSGENNEKNPYSAETILEAVNVPSIRYPVILIPSTKKGHGTGHLRRCLDLALENSYDIYISPDSDLEEANKLVEDAFEKGLKKSQVVVSLDGIENYSLAVTDLFRTEESFARELASKVTVCSMDDGAEHLNHAEYLLDVIPSADSGRYVNAKEPGFIPLPSNRRKSDRNAQIKNALVVLGGEDPRKLAKPACVALAQAGVDVTGVVSPDLAEIYDKSIPESLGKKIRFLSPIDNLREKLHEYDLVVTHYGFTAFEAAGANCATILLGTTPLHAKLSKSYGFKCLEPSRLNSEEFKKCLKDPSSLYVDFSNKNGAENLSSFVKKIAAGNRFDCPVCRNEKGNRGITNPIVARTRDRTFRRCSCCGMVYISWTVKEKQTEYNRAYFFEDYEKQYGKTYLDDFSSIKAQCTRRVGVIERLRKKRNSHASKQPPSVLDIGCAMGPFLSAANECGWQVFGADISRDAVEYVRNSLKFPAAVVQFPDADFEKSFNKKTFDAVTMWYVIEHFQNLDGVLKKVSSIMNENGIFAFSTPSGSGVSARFSTQGFYEQSPSDHFSVWEIKRANSILKRYGFRILKIVPTGIHPERFPAARKNGWKGDSIQMKALELVSRLLKLGDTFEIYCVKEKSK